MIGARVWAFGIVCATAAVAGGCGGGKSNSGAGGAAGTGGGTATAGGTAGGGGAGGGAALGGSGGAAGSAGEGTGTGGKPHVVLKLGVDPPVTGMFTDDRDKTQYGWVTINGVKWMSENLRFVLDPQDLQTCYFDPSKLAEDCSIAGYFYGWSAAIGQPRIANALTLKVADGTYQGVCPDGWHLPTRAEWVALFDYVNQLAKADPPTMIFDVDYRDISDPVLSAMGWTGGYGTNELGFNAKPYDELSLGTVTSFWASDESGRQAAELVKVYGNDINVGTDLKEYRQAVRCVEGAATKPAPMTAGPMLTNTTDTFQDTRDNQSYATVKIGTQDWFAQNLNYKPPTGDSLCYANSDDHCRIFGRLYGYDLAQSVCPTGWHIPSVDEWHTLGQFIDDNSGKGGVTENQGSFTWNIGKQILAPWEVWQGGPTTPPTFGFNGLPGGFALDDDQSGSLEEEAVFWSAKGATTDQIAVTINTTYLSTAPVTNGVESYVRCLQD